jgi:hypothetical protein
MINPFSYFRSVTLGSTNLPTRPEADCGAPDDAFTQVLDVLAGLQFLRRRAATAAGWQDGLINRTEVDRFWNCASLVLHQTTTIGGASVSLPIGALEREIKRVTRFLHPPRNFVAEDSACLLALLDGAIAEGYRILPLARAIVFANHNHEYANDHVLAHC